MYTPKRREMEETQAYKSEVFHQLMVNSDESGKVKKEHKALGFLPKRKTAHSAMTRPKVRYVDPKTNELSDAVTFGIDVFMKAGISSSTKDARIIVEQDENKDLVVKTGEGGLPAGCYTIRNDFTGMMSRMLIRQVIPMVTSSKHRRENFVRVASVVLPIIKFAGGKEYLLLTQRTHMKKGTYNDFWVFPGGHVEQNETLVEGGLREVSEETGLKIHAEDLHPLCVWQEFMASSNKQLQFIITNFYCEIEVEEEFTEQNFLLTLGLQMKEVKTAVLMPKSTWLDLAQSTRFRHTRKYAHTAFDDINWESGENITQVVGIVNKKNHVELTKVDVKDIVGHTSEKPGIGSPHSFAVRQLLKVIIDKKNV